MTTSASDVCNQMYGLAWDRPGEDVWQRYNNVPVLIVQNRASADRILRVNQENYRKAMAWFRQSLGASRFSEDGDQWRVRRDISHPYMTHFDRQQVCLTAHEKTLETVRDLVECGSSGAQRLDDNQFRHLTVSILCRVFLKMDFDQSGIDLGLMARMMEYGSAYAFIPPGKTDSLYADELKELPGIRRQLLAQFKSIRNARIPESGLLCAMQAADSNPANSVILEHELLTFLAAGAESSAATVGWACYLLALHPQIQEQLRNEILAIEDIADWERLSQCQLLLAFLSETLRLFPPSPISTRQAVAADRLGDNDLAPGQIVLVSYIGLCNSTSRPESPWSVNLDTAFQGPCAGQRMGFSIGPRVCGGKWFAIVELMAILSTFLKHLRFELTNDAPPRFFWKAQMLREGGQPVRVSRIRD